MVNNTAFAQRLIQWYKKNARELPWRETADPYKIWLSEIILQQTRVVQGLPYYNKFIDAFENVSKLAQADEQSVLRLWQGLGYYSRARNLHKCAREIHENFNNFFPTDYKSLLKLPGIGKYTAAAIASFSFKEKVPVIDGNVYRVLARVFGLSDDIASGKGHKEFEKLAWQLIPGESPDIYNQAIMEFGAMHCTPKTPLCEDCIFNVECVARQQNLQGTLPVKSKKVKVTNRYFNYVVLNINGSMVLNKRLEGDIWQGLYDFPLLEAESFLSIDDVKGRYDLLKEIKESIHSVDVSEDYKHILTHRRIFARFFTIHLDHSTSLINLLKRNNLHVFTEKEVEDLPKPVLVSRYLNDVIF
ncbi:A/G-specific adenine glycosylase [Fulvivirga ligni]|uniref:A/G-specific adenine glycosylase n=1 Tax=Fulvivirga ligni TaxID=2904246 RepID=UPI001F15A9D7|nr:A/G-specific adenine glycosylase [Fulvivirga ligni]UII22108.1 A/G-specific adenine glycosylase [Fulvivirga ligni]